MSRRLAILLVLGTSGCLTTGTVSTSLERSSAGLETLLDPDGAHMVVQELGSSEGLTELAVSTAQRELDVEGFEIREVATEGRGWKKGGKAGRNLLWVASVAAGWVGAFGVSWETADGRVMQIGGLGGEAQTWQGVAALVGAVGGIGAGTQQTVATRQPGSTSTTLLGREQVLMGSRSVDLAPLVGQALNLGLGDGGLLSVPTDAEGRASLSGLELPTSSWRDGLDLSASGLRGAWQPSDGLRRDLLAMPADWSTPFHGSLAEQLSTVAKQADGGGLIPDLPLAELTTATGAIAQLELLPVEQQAQQAEAWIMQLETYAEAAAAQREVVHLDWLRSSASMARQSAAGVGASLAMMDDLPADMISPLFQPMELFRQLPDDALSPVEAIGGPAIGARDPRVVLLEAGPCAVSDALGALAAGRVVVDCSGARVVVGAGQDLHLAEARAWVIAGILDAPVGLRQAGSERATWLPVVKPLYAASLARSSEGQVSFSQVLDDEGLLASGVLRRVGE